jgi:hypothetical protein
MQTHKIEAHKITKPIQLMAVWFIALLLIDAAFLTAAAKINSPAWLAPSLVISAIAFVPLFLVGVFLMQTVFRKELQDDQFYSEWLKRQEETFEDFAPENVSINRGINVNISGSSNITAGGDIAIDEEDLETKRIKSYEGKKGLFLVHTWRPSFTQGQVADIVIWLQQHGKGPLSNGNVEKVEYQLGPKFFKRPRVKTNQSDSFRLEVSAYGPMLCLASVYIKGEQKPLLIERYINFEEAPNKALQPTAKLKR